MLFFEDVFGTSEYSLCLQRILTIPLFSLEEQKEIGDFFSKLDEKIQIEKEKLSALEKQKSLHATNVHLMKTAPLYFIWNGAVTAFRKNCITYGSVLLVSM